MQVDLVTGGMSYAVFLLSTTCHEAAHAWAALRLGDDTAYRGGQVTLDPTPHVRRAPMGMVVVPLLTFLFGNGSMMGWASAPYDPEWALRYPRRCALMALAGPTANFILMLLSAMLMYAGIRAGVFEAPYHFTWMHLVQATRDGFWPFIGGMLSLFFSMNVLLGTFNLLPLPPLDGASLPLLFLPEETGRSFMGLRNGLGFLGIVIAWQLFDSVFPPVWTFMVTLFFGRGSLF